MNPAITALRQQLRAIEGSLRAIEGTVLAEFDTPLQRMSLEQIDAELARLPVSSGSDEILYRRAALAKARGDLLNEKALDAYRGEMASPAHLRGESMRQVKDAAKELTVRNCRSEWR